jgi:hypothetical protein
MAGLALASLFASQGAMAATTATPDIGIGGEEVEPQTHISFEGVPKDAKIVSISTQLIEYGINKPNTVPWKWARNVEYILTIERGKQLHLPAGTNAQFKVAVPERTMWE